MCYRLPLLFLHHLIYEMYSHPFLFPCFHICTFMKKIPKLRLKSDSCYFMKDCIIGLFYFVVFYFVFSPDLIGYYYFLEFYFDIVTSGWKYFFMYYDLF